MHSITITWRKGTEANAKLQFSERERERIVIIIRVYGKMFCRPTRYTYILQRLWKRPSRPVYMYYIDAYRYVRYLRCTANGVWMAVIKWYSFRMLTKLRPLQVENQLENNGQRWSMDIVLPTTIEKHAWIYLEENRWKWLRIVNLKFSLNRYLTLFLQHFTVKMTWYFYPNWISIFFFFFGRKNEK